MEQIITLDAVREKLIGGGFTGLYNHGGPCACHIDDLAPCGECSSDDEEWINGCDAGYKHIDPRSKFGDWVVSCSKEPPTPRSHNVGAICLIIGYSLRGTHK